MISRNSWARALKQLAVSLALVVSSACGDDDGSSGPDASSGGDARSESDGRSQNDASGNATCTLTATATADVAARTINGVGSIRCSGTASIMVETCVQWNPSGTFEDIMCLSSTTSGAELDVENLASCGLGMGRSYRARVNASVDGTDQAEKLSAEVRCE